MQIGRRLFNVLCGVAVSFCVSPAQAVSPAEVTAALAGADAVKASAAALGRNTALTSKMAVDLKGVVASRCAHKREVAEKAADTLRVVMDGREEIAQVASRAELWRAGVPTDAFAVLQRLMDASTPRSDDMVGALVGWLVALRRCIASDDNSGLYRDGVTADVAREWSELLQRVLTEFQGNVAVVTAVVWLYELMSGGDAAARAQLVPAAGVVVAAAVRHAGDVTVAERVLRFLRNLAAYFSGARVAMAGHLDFALHLMRSHIEVGDVVRWGVGYLYWVSEDTPAVAATLKSRVDDIAPLLRDAEARHGHIGGLDVVMKVVTA